MLQYFLQAGLKPDQKDKQGNCALLQAAAYNTGEVLHLLAKSSTNPMITNEQGESIVHLAVSNQNMETLNTALTELGMPVNETTNEGLTPLHLAAMQAKDTKMLQFLLDHGADKERPDAGRPNAQPTVRAKYQSTWLRQPLHTLRRDDPRQTRALYD